MPQTEPLDLNGFPIVNNNATDKDIVIETGDAAFVVGEGSQGDSRCIAMGETAKARGEYNSVLGGFFSETESGTRFSAALGFEAVANNSNELALGGGFGSTNPSNHNGLFQSSIITMSARSVPGDDWVELKADDKSIVMSAPVGMAWIFRASIVGFHADEVGVFLLEGGCKKNTGTQNTNIQLIGNPKKTKLASENPTLDVRVRSELGRTGPIFEVKGPSNLSTTNWTCRLDIAQVLQTLPKF